MTFGEIVLVSLAIAAASMTVSKSNAMFWFRGCFVKVVGWIHDEWSELAEELIHCPYCLSHWLAAISVVAMLRAPIGEMIIVGLAMVTLASLASLGIAYFFSALDALDRSEE